MGDLFGLTPPIKVISLWQPWASLVTAGLKRHETRHWDTDHRGLIGIHAAKRLDLAGAPEALCQAAFGRFWQHELPRGELLAIATLANTWQAQAVAARLTAADLASGNFTHGRFAWRLEDVRRLIRPIPLVGRQGLFNWEPPHNLEATLGPIIDHATACNRIGWGGGVSPVRAALA